MSDRYSRQTVLPEVGVEGQERLRATSVLVVGAGGLGCAVLQYLCAAGIGRIVIMDHDRVEESNLHRQPLYRMSDLGALKVEAARTALLQMNPEVRFEVIGERLTPANVASVVSKAQLIVDAADSFAATYVLSDECYTAGKPLISASVLGLSGYVGAFCGGAPSYRAVFPEMPRQAGSCATAGVLGTAVGVMGTLQAHMTLALALDLAPNAGAELLRGALGHPARAAVAHSGGDTTAGQPSAHSMRVDPTHLVQEPIARPTQCAALGQLVTVDFRTLRFGGFSFATAQEPIGTAIPFIDPRDVADTDIVIDLRSLTEAPVSPFASALRIGVDRVERAEERLPQGPRVVLCCRTGVRAWRAARALQNQGHVNVALIALGD